MVEPQSRADRFGQAHAPLGDHGGEFLKRCVQGEQVGGAQGEAGADQRLQALHLGGRARLLQQMIGGGMQAVLGEKVSANEPGAGLGADGLGLQLKPSVVPGQMPGLLGGRGRLAQSRDIARTARELAPDDGGFE